MVPSNGMEKTVNYIVAIYAGARRLYPGKTPVDVFLQKQFAFLNSNPKHITHVSFVFNDSDDVEQSRYVEMCKHYLTNSKYQGYVKVRNNKSVSYGAWEECLKETLDLTTHSFLIEDDYIPIQLDFLDYFFEKEKEDVCFVASLFDRNHAAIANGLINNRKAKQTLYKHNRIFDLVDDVSYENGSYYNQINFLNLIEGQIVDITDIAYTQFLGQINRYGHNKVVVNYRNTNLPLLIIPILL